MDGLTNKNFGLLIAYVVPGFVALWGLAQINPIIAEWLSGPHTSGPSIGGVLYVTVASVGLGMIASATRWVVIDTLHSLTGLRRPSWSDQDLHERIAAYAWIIENYYRYYQFYGNTLIALAFAYAIWRTHLPETPPGLAWIDASLATVAVILFAGSRSALARYFRRAGDLIAAPDPSQKEIPMTNGGGHPKSSTKPQPKPQPPAQSASRPTSESQKPKPGSS
ncbi:MAG: hypothetical protein AAGI17_08500 [Planctomycetota bacterium]